MNPNQGRRRRRRMEAVKYRNCLIRVMSKARLREWVVDSQQVTSFADRRSAKAILIYQGKKKCS
jgi:hypothetical protein